MRRLDKVASIFFTAIGFSLLIGAVVLLVKTQIFRQNAQQAQGTILEIQTETDKDDNTFYKPVVQFQIDGDNIEYVPKNGSLNEEYETGQTVSVLYTSQNPKDIQLANEVEQIISFTLTAIIIGFIFAAIGAIMLGWRLRKKRKIATLVHSGKVVEAEITKVVEMWWKRWVAQSPYYMYCEYSENGNTYKFKSDVWYDYHFELEKRIPDKKINVYLQPDNYTRYYVHLSFTKKQL